MQSDLDESLDAYSEFVMMGESLDAVSQKIAFNNASAINRQEALDAKKTSAIRKEETYEESQNEFLNVSKWKKGKESMIKKDMANVEMDVQQRISQNKWQKKQEKIAEPEQDIIADESCVPEQQENGNEDEIADETIDHIENEDEDETTQGMNNDDEDENQEESSQESAEDIIDRSQKQALTGLKKNEITMKEELKPQSATSTQRSKQEDDITDAQSQMKRTDYLPSKWSKKQSSQLSEVSQSSPLNKWAKKQAVLKRILLLVQ